MKNFVSPVNHPESTLSGSTVESMIDRTKELDIPYFASTDNGSLTSTIKGYKYAQKKGIKFIAGVELFFKDDECEIIKNTASENIKYFKVIIHAKDQDAYQALVKKVSEPNKKKIWVMGHEHSAYNWKDLEDLAQHNITICTSNIEGMVSKHMLVGRTDLGLKYYEKLRSLVGCQNFYPTIIPQKQDKYWNTLVNVKLGDKEVQIPASDRIATDRYKRAKAIELTRPNSSHKKIYRVFINKMPFNVKKEYQEIKDAKLINVFQEVPGGDLQTKANKFIIALARKFGDEGRILLSSYSYYAEKDDKIVQDMKLGEEARVYQAQYIAATDDVMDYLKYELELSDSSIQAYIDNTYKWAHNFDDFELKYDYRLPIPEGDPQKMLVDIIKKTGRMKWDDPVYVKQFREEFELLTNNGVIDLIPYFLPIVDVYKFYERNRHLTGPARGSAGGFLISYLLGITHIDPIKYGLYSSRFLTMDRVQQGNFPDIDCDLESRAPLVGDDGNSGYLFKKYGKKAAQISTRTLLRIKSAMLDANRFVNGGKVEPEIQALAKSLPNTPQGTTDYKFVFGYEKDGNHVPGLLENNEDLQRYATERPKEWDIVKRALSLARQHSRHACAYLISDTEIEETIPIMEVGSVKRVTQPEAGDCEWAGLIKYDFLVVSALKDINLAIKYINKKNNSLDLQTGHFLHNNKDTYIWDLPEDKEVFDMLGEGKTESVFQLNTTSVTPFVKTIKPKSIIDCATITSLVRPGPLDFVDEKTGRNMVEEYVERKYGRSKSDIPVLEEMLPETYGVLVFQEQVTKLAKELAGMNAEDAENVRIGVGKKKQHLIDSLKPVFIEGAAKKVGEETADRIWSMMETFARYGFNKSHAVAYSVISYACAFLKYHYPLEWWAAVLSNADDKEINEVFYKYVKDKVLPPDINTSTEQMSVDYKVGKIRNKLSMISGLGPKAAEKIISGRPYRDLKDFVEKKVCGPAMTRKLIHVGVLDSLFEDERTLEAKIEKFEKTVNLVAFEEKLKTYDEKIANAKDEKEVKRHETNKARYKKKGPKPIEVDPKYISIPPKINYLMKKSIFPTMNLDLVSVLEKNSRFPIVRGSQYNMLTDESGRDVRILDGEHLQQIDNNMVNKDIYFCVPGYVMDSSVFDYSNGSKKALKVLIDSSGYISEKVIWPDYNTGELKYPKSLKKGCIAWFVYGKKVGKPYTNIYNILIEEKPLD